MAHTDYSEIHHHQEHAAVDLLGLDHVALAVADVGAMTAFLCDDLGLHELARNADAVRIGADAGAAHLVLRSNEGPREPGALGRIVLRVADLQRAVAALPRGTEVTEEAPDLVTFEGPEGLGMAFALVAGGGIEYDLDHVILRVADPEETRIALAELGCVPRGEALHIADKHIRLEELPGFAERPLLDHIALQVRSRETLAAQARRRDLQIAESLAPDILTVVLPGLEQIRIAFVEARAATYIL